MKGIIKTTGFFFSNRINRISKNLNQNTFNPQHFRLTENVYVIKKKNVLYLKKEFEVVFIA